VLSASPVAVAGGAAIAGVIIVGCSRSSSDWARRGVTVDQGCVLVNADVHTMDPSRPRASAVAMAGGGITGTGDGDQLRAANPGARVVDIGGRVVIPGFVDAHCHFELTTTHLSYAVPLHAPPHSSLREICRTLRDRAASAPGSGWIVGRANFGLHQFVAEQRPITRPWRDHDQRHRALGRGRPGIPEAAPGGQAAGPDRPAVPQSPPAHLR
jgi:hypothetical protein